MAFKSTKSVGILLAIIGILLFSIKAVFVKLAYQYEVTSIHLLLFRMLFALPFYIGILLFRKPEKIEAVKTRKDYLMVVALGITGYYLASYFDFLGLQYIKAGLERIILFVYPTLVLIISRVFLKKHINQKQVLAIVITYLGILVTFWNEAKFEGENLYYGAVLIFLSALTYAIYIVGSGNYIPKFGVITFTSYAMIVSCCFVFIHYFITDRNNILVYDFEVYLYGFLMAVFCTIIPSYLVSAAIEKLGSSTFAIFGSLGPVSTISMAYFFLGEKLHWLQIIGTIIVILGIYIVGKSKKE